MAFDGHAFIDWDDTVAENIRYFHEVEAANSALIARVTAADQAVVQRRGEAIDVATARRMGLVRDSFSTAWLECLREFASAAGVQPDPDVVEAIRLACQRPYEVEQEIFAGAAEALGWLVRQGIEVTVWTAGDVAVQSRKIRRSGLQHLVHRQVIVPSKTPERLMEALAGRDRSRCFVVGNSIHSDVRPALTLGLLAMHIPVETWAYDSDHLDHSNPNYHQIGSIADLPSAVIERLGDRFRLTAVGEE